MVGLGFEDNVSASSIARLNPTLVYGAISKTPFVLQVRASHFEGLITTIVGYVLLAVTLILCHVSFFQTEKMSFRSTCRIQRTFGRFVVERVPSINWSVLTSVIFPVLYGEK